MDAIETRLLRTLRKDLTTEIDSKTQAIASGAATDFAFYREQCGELRGLKNALEMADAIERRIHKEEC